MSGYEGFMAATGDPFALPDGFHIVLHDVTEPTRHGRLLSYSLRFHSPIPLTLDPGATTLSHPRLGEHPLLLSPADAPDTDDHVYEAICCHDLDDGCP